MDDTVTNTAGVAAAGSCQLHTKQSTVHGTQLALMRALQSCSATSSSDVSAALQSLAPCRVQASMQHDCKRTPQPALVGDGGRSTSTTSSTSMHVFSPPTMAPTLGPEAAGCSSCRSAGGDVAVTGADGGLASWLSGAVVIEVAGLMFARGLVVSAGGQHGLSAAVVFQQCF